MPYQILHPSAFSAKEDIQMDESAFLFITTYGMAKRLDMLKDKQWDILILDEAQAIKNPGTKQTKHIKEIPGRIKIAMTGTPIENQLGDLWSLFDFLNPGLLGDKKEFTDFAKQLNLNPAGYAKLRKMISPFLLRRLKTDKQIISDLPEKVEINEYAQLSKKQIALYRQLVDQIAEKIDETERKDRSGLVLSSIVKFKQICNHPDQYLGREDYKPTASGKFQQLAEICETIYEKREKVLVFTQFRELTEPLSEYLKEIFNKEGYVLHGGTSVKKRSEMVETFNSDRYIPYMVLSLKAGGVGLNLAAANHVIHFDRWWNPAVENQATDRAFRIGQSKNVMVHKFVTKGTIEEKIDEMINEKRKLAEDVLSSAGEKWISELGNDELMELFRLGGI
jgi:non-specific serine/threonine protein kinase